MYPKLLCFMGLTMADIQEFFSFFQLLTMNKLSGAGHALQRTPAIYQHHSQ
jgi:hypothetical protein